MKHRSVSEVGYQRSRILPSETYAQVKRSRSHGHHLVIHSSQIIHSVFLQLFLTPTTRSDQPRLGSTQVAA
jgi:hypothetical protein